MEELLDKPERVHKKRKRTFLLVLTITIVAMYTIATVLSFLGVRSILYSGPALAVVGVIALIVGLILREKIVILFGSWVLVSVLGVFLLIFSFRISPRQAEPIVPIVGTLCALTLIGLVVWLFMSLRER